MAPEIGAAQRHVVQKREQRRKHGGDRQVPTPQGPASAEDGHQLGLGWRGRRAFDRGDFGAHWMEVLGSSCLVLRSGSSLLVVRLQFSGAKRRTRNEERRTV